MGNEVGGTGKLSGPGLVYLIIRFSCVKTSLLSMTEAWTAHGVLPKTQNPGREGGKEREKAQKEKKVLELNLKHHTYRIGFRCRMMMKI